MKLYLAVRWVRGNSPCFANAKKKKNLAVSTSGFVMLIETSCPEHQKLFVIG